MKIVFLLFKRIRVKKFLKNALTLIKTWAKILKDSFESFGPENFKKSLLFLLADLILPVSQ
jgi:hypothetical protein